MEDKQLSRRAGQFTLVLILIFLILSAQLANLQVLQQSYFISKADAQRFRSLPIMAPRGEIFDRNGQVIASNRPAYTVSVHYPYYEDEELQKKLSEVLSIPLEEIRKKVRDKTQKERRLFDPIRLKTDLSPEVHTILVERQADLPGVTVEVQPIREYRLGDEAAQVIGYVGEISPDQLQQDRWKQQNYRPGDIVGKTGLEYYYEEYLRGRDGSQQVEVDYRFRPTFRNLGQIDPEPGNNLILTIDAKLQKVAEMALDQTLERIRTYKGSSGPYPNARTGAAVVIDVKTGEILAMVNRPGYDLNLFAAGISPDDYKRLAQDPLKPFHNRAISGVYAPGSTFKMVGATAALEYQVITENDTVFCDGFYDKVVIGKKCWNWRDGGHGAVDMRRALKVSCDIYFYEMGYRLGNDRLVEYALAYGFGQPTGIDLAGEAVGTIPTEEWVEKERTRRKDPNFRLWRGDDLNTVIGQGYVTATPLQLAMYTAAVANGGTLYRPHLVKRIVSPSGEILKEFAPEERAKVPASPENLKIVREGMLEVTRPGGTSAWTFYDFPIPVAAKTGTAQKAGQEYDNAIFVAFAPYDDPQIAIAIVVEQGGSGSLTSPIAKAVFAEYFGIPLKDGDPAKIIDPNAPPAADRPGAPAQGQPGTTESPREQPTPPGGTEPTPEPAPEPAPEPSPEPAPEPAPEPTPEPAPVEPPQGNQEPPPGFTQSGQG